MGSVLTTLHIPTSELGFGYDLKLQPWKQGMTGYRVFSDGNQEEIEGNLGLGLNVLSGYSDDSAWIDEIPPHLKDQTADFPDVEYYMLWLAANSYKAAQILLCRPLLLVLLCRAFPSDKNEALEICELGQRQILVKLGFDGNKAALKFLDKLQLNYKTGQELVYIERYLNSKTKDYLRFKHYPVVNDLVLSVDQTLPILTGTKLGRGLAEAKGHKIWNQIGYVKDTVRLGNWMGIREPMLVIRELSSYDDLVALHDRWTEQRILKRTTRPDDAEIPYPVLVGNYDDRLVPILNYDELLQESAEQQHCIVSYHSMLAAGTYIAFKMETPERVTIGIKVRPEGRQRFEIDQIKCKNNKEPSEAAKALVYELVGEFVFERDYS